MLVREMRMSKIPLRRKQILLTMVFTMVVVLTVSAQYQMQCTEDRGNEIILNFSILHYDFTDKLINGEHCVDVHVEDACYLNEKGFPRLPKISQSVIIPDNAAMDFEVNNIRYKDITVQKVVPAKGIIYRNQNPEEVPYTFNGIYEQDTWYPSQLVTLSEPYIMRDMRGIVVSFQPFQYNPVLEQLRIVKSIIVTVKKVGPGVINVLQPRQQPVSPTFEKIYKKRFINYTQNRSRYPAVADGERMVIISPTHYLNAVKPLAEWKNKKGIKTTIHDYIPETGGGAEGVLSFLQNKYTTENLAYVLLIGDIQDILCFYVEGRGGDPIYALLSGKDNYPDIFVGRFSGESEAQIQTMVHKVIQYEKEPDPNGEWYAKAMGIASSEGTPPDKEWMDDFRDVMLAYNYSSVDQIYEPNASKSAVTNGIHEGRSWINYMGHGNKDFWGTAGFSNRDIENLTNTNKLPIIISVACYNGDFSSGLPCFGEAWLRHGSPTDAKGAVICAASSIMQPWEPPQHAQKEIVKHLCEDTYISVGGIFFNGEMKMIENGDGDNTFKSWNLFGDASLQVFTDKPVELDVTCPEKVGTGKQDVTISFGAAIDGRACLYSEAAGIVGSKIISGTSVTVAIDVAESETELQLTITARNRMPFQKKVPVGITAIVEKENSTAKTGYSFNAAPNPADKNSDGITFVYRSADKGQARLAVYDAVGNSVFTYRFPFGNKGMVQWDMTSRSGRTVAGGIYRAMLTLKDLHGAVTVLKNNVGIKEGSGTGE